MKYSIIAATLATMAAAVPNGWGEWSDVTTTTTAVHEPVKTTTTTTTYTTTATYTTTCEEEDDYPEPTPSTTWADIPEHPEPTPSTTWADVTYTTTKSTTKDAPVHPTPSTTWADVTYTTKHPEYSATSSWYVWTTSASSYKPTGTGAPTKGSGKPNGTSTAPIPTWTGAANKEGIAFGAMALAGLAILF